MLCQLLLYNKVNQLNVYICPLPFEPSSHSTRLSLWLTHQESACNAGDPGSIPVSGRYLEKGMATPSTRPPSFPSRSSESSKLSPLCYTELPTSRLFHTWQCIYVNAALSICPTLSFPHYVHKFVLCLDLHMSVSLCRQVHQSHLSIFHMCVLIYDICLSLSD